MHTFSRATIIKAFDLGVFRTHSELDKFMLLFSLENIIQSTATKNEKKVAIIRHLIQNPYEKGPNGGNLSFEIIEQIINEPTNDYGNAYLELENSLKRDGYCIENNKLMSVLPEFVQLPEKENELFLLLDNLNFITEKGHLEQAISAHSRSDWASANAQLRTFLEGFFDSIAEKLANDNATLPSPGHLRRKWLANQLNPPFLRTDLGEWHDDSKSFIEGLFKRLHPKGSHPGLSDEEDSTYRLHLVLLTALYFLRRLVQIT
jgi:hypothetical protein